MINPNNNYDRNNTINTRKQTGNKLALSAIDERFQQAINEIQNQFIIYDNLTKNQMPGADNILRSQIFFLDSALDLYVRDIVQYGFRRLMDCHWDIAGDRIVITVKLSVLKQCVSCSNSEKIKDKLMKEFNYSIRTSMKFDAIIKNLGLVGITLPHKWTDEKNEERNELKHDIDELSNRRNTIGHNSDLDDKREKINITKDEVKKYIERVEQLHDIIIASVNWKNNKKKSNTQHSD